MGLRVDFLEEEGGWGCLLATRTSHQTLVLQQATHHHPQSPPAFAAAAGQRQHLRVPATAADEVSGRGLPHRGPRARSPVETPGSGPRAMPATCKGAIWGGGWAEMARERTMAERNRHIYWASIMGGDRWGRILI